jgi:hypothetical protein
VPESETVAIATVARAKKTPTAAARPANTPMRRRRLPPPESTGGSVAARPDSSSRSSSPGATTRTVSGPALVEDTGSAAAITGAAIGGVDVEAAAG